MITIIITAIIGLIISSYTFFLEQKIKTEPQYKPFCNISDAISCTKPITSIYGKLFGISNSIIGAGFYNIIILLSFMQLYSIIFYLSLIACFFSAYLAWILFTKIKTICLLCIAIYIINVVLLLLSYFHP